MKTGRKWRRALCLLLSLALIPAMAGTAAAEAEQEPGQELISNGDFSGALNWQLYTESEGKADLAVENGELVVNVHNGGKVEHAIQPYYDGFKLIQGVSYELSWDVRSTVERYMQVRIQLNGGDYHAYAQERLKAGEQTEHHSIQFTMEEATDPAPRLCVNMGNVPEEEGGEADPATLGEHQVFFDNFSLKVTDASSAVAEEEDPDARGIRVNQVGYKPDAAKTAVFAGVSVDDGAFKVLKADSGETAFEGTAGPAEENAWAGETDRVADFSGLTEPGTYVVEAADGTRSPVFVIAEDVYGELLRAAVRMLTLQRCGTALDESVGGDFAHPECHVTEALVLGTDERIDVSGGWHDAGDYGRYTVSGAKAAADLLQAWERLGAKTDDVGIPESGDGVDDLLQEAKYELDWLLKMQREDGGVYHKVSCRNFPAFVSPEKETDELVVSPVSNTATGDFAGVMALAGRIFAKSGDEALAAAADGYTAAAEKAWTYLEAHKGDPGFKNPEDVVTGEYPDDNDEDEYLWAAAELARTTGKEAYRKAAEELLDAGGARPGLGWLDIGSYGVYAVLKDEGAGEAAKEKARALMRAFADKAMETAGTNPYGIDRTDTYEWGSNMGVANTGAILQMAAETLGMDECAAAARRYLDYLLGENATGYCFVTAFGAKSPEHPHHRPSTAGGHAVPGMLVGGPDNGLEDPYAAAALAGKPPAKCYADSDQTYSTNEVCVYWNSPMILLIAGE